MNNRIAQDYTVTLWFDSLKPVQINMEKTHCGIKSQEQISHTMEVIRHFTNWTNTITHTHTASCYRGESLITFNKYNAEKDQLMHYNSL